MTFLKTVPALALILAAQAASAEKGTPAPAQAAPAATTEATAPEATATAEAAPAAAASAGLVMASDPAGVLAAMQAEGFTATLGTDDVGDPMISGVVDGTNYQVYFYGCQANADCQSLLFNAGYDLPSGSTADVVNGWNAGQLVGQAYLDDEQDPHINYFVTTTGGLTTENFADVLDWWKVTLPDFEQRIGY